nr:hypothetical protein GCM10020092_025310 [Actinoplanes digitatis]
MHPPRSPRPHTHTDDHRAAGWLGFAAAVVVALGSGVLAVAVTGTAQAATVGASSYTETLPAGAKLPAGCGNMSANPRQYLTPNAPAGPVPTNDWWSSLLFKKGDDCNFSQALFAGLSRVPAGGERARAVLPDRRGHQRQRDRPRRIPLPVRAARRRRRRLA